MTTTELIAILKQYELGASGRPREVAIVKQDESPDEDGFNQIRFLVKYDQKLVLNSTGEGLLTQLSLRVV